MANLFGRKIHFRIILSVNQLSHAFFYMSLRNFLLGDSTKKRLKKTIVFYGHMVKGNDFLIRGDRLSGTDELCYTCLQYRILSIYLKINILGNREAMFLSGCSSKKKVFSLESHLDIPQKYT